jgi:hypothetical protein
MIVYKHGEFPAAVIAFRIQEAPQVAEYFSQLSFAVNARVYPNALSPSTQQFLNTWCTVGSLFSSLQGLQYDRMTKLTWERTLSKQRPIPFTVDRLANRVVIMIQLSEVENIPEALPDISWLTKFMAKRFPAGPEAYLKGKSLPLMMGRMWKHLVACNSVELKNAEWCSVESGWPLMEKILPTLQRSWPGFFTKGKDYFEEFLIQQESVLKGLAESKGMLETTAKKILNIKESVNA